MKTYTITLRIDENTLKKILYISKNYNLSMSKILFYSYLDENLFIIKKEIFDNSLVKGCSDMIDNFNKIKKILKQHEIFFQLYLFFKVEKVNTCFKKINRMITQDYKICKNLEQQLQDEKRNLYIRINRRYVKSEFLTFLTNEEFVELNDEFNKYSRTNDI